MVNLLLDILIPQQTCCLCRKTGNYTRRQPWCYECHNEIVALQNNAPICDKCGKYLEKNTGLCEDCATTPPAFHIARAVGPYEDPYRISIKVLKFLGRKHLSLKMGCLMAEVILKEPRFWPIDLLVPVPISEGNLKQRGFNQTEELANQISKQIKVKVDATSLVRVKETPSQRELSKEEREKNLLCAFKLKDSKKVQGKKILLIDDVYTTGSTSRECTRVLLEGGADRVCVITWATGRGY